MTGRVFLIGALVGALLTAPLIAVFFAAQLVGLPFVPFDLFDWLARALPGAVVTFGIDSMVGVVSLLRAGELSEVAKTAEQLLALLTFFLAGVVMVAALFAIFARLALRSVIANGAASGLAVGVTAAALSLRVSGDAAAPPLVAAAWIVLAFAAWGAASGWAFSRLYPETSATPARPATSSGVAARDGSATGAAEVERLDRRRFLIRLGGATAAITVAGAGVAVLLRDEGAGRLEETRNVPLARAWSERSALPNAAAAVEPVPGTRPEYTLPDDHYRIDINLSPPVVEGDSWRLRVGGLVEAETEFSLERLRSYEPLHQFITLSCISNPLGGDLISTTRWTGVSLQRLLPDLQLRSDATHLRISSVDGFYEVVPLETIAADERVMLAYEWDGLPLPVENGFPLRIYIPDLYGMKQPKWIDRIEAISAWEEGFWVVRGWDAKAQMRATSVIDTVAADMIEQRDGSTTVPIGGIAHAGARGISRVEVRVDDGEWREAQLRTPLSELTWVVWRFDWPFEPGSHTFTVRCFDGSGEPQVAERNPVRPSGATGLLSESARL